ncbi:MULTISPECIES: FecR domain-containing protein [unclassified Acinetobacter]|uniref:FecR family protein n=1 Tax=unclassified Acinetobacter TaxID=196816 RepID=UPI0018AA67A0|nr:MULTISPECIES: FecR domain-containing protein [unclassified Acinetobacter]MBJ9952993.1 FecR domain-containing protein [Acinetobacter baumannii]
MNAKQLRKDMALWIVRLNADDQEERRQAQIEFELWRSQYPEYQGQLDEMLSFSETMQQLSITHGISGQNVQHSMHVSQQSKTQILKLFTKVFVLCLSVGTVTYFAYHSILFSYYTADLKTNTGEMQSFTLDDGSKVTLGARSAINLNFKTDQRQIDLIQGDIYIDVAKDPNRPLIIHTPQADYKALGTRFIVYQYPKHSVLNMLHSKVEATALQSNHLSKVVQQGENITAGSQGLSQISDIDIAATAFAWQKQQILANDLPLSDLLTRLERYHHQYLIFNRASLQQYKVSGVINTQQDLEKTLALLAMQYPLKIKKIGQYVITISTE